MVRTTKAKAKAEVKAKGNHHSVARIVKEFVETCEPLEADPLLLFTDNCTGARYSECHIQASKLIEKGTIDVPLDPDEQSEYRANRELREDHAAFVKMQNDAKHGRSFSNIVAEYTTAFDSDHPIKIVGGQHRFKAIADAFADGVDAYHGVKVYFGLDMTQRLDVQLISNTNIAISPDLFDRMQETFKGSQLRDWCQKSGLLPAGEDFVDQSHRGGKISVRFARTFITNYFSGSKVDPAKFAQTSTAPIICRSGELDHDWDDLVASRPDLWGDAKLIIAAAEFALLVKAQRQYFAGKQPKPKPDFPEKASNPALYSAWAYVAGVLRSNDTRLKRHYALRKSTGKDPLNAAALAKGRHKTDAENYRGLGYRSDPRERGRFVELFFLQAEDGSGITPKNIEVAIKSYEAKVATLEVIKAKEKK